MDKPIKPPHSAPEPGGKDMQSSSSQRERDDNYAHVLVNCRDNWRIISARTGDQWVIQKRSSSTNTGVFLGKCHCTTRKSLIAACSRLRLLSADVQAVLEARPDHASGQSLPETQKDTKRRNNGGQHD
jgi:hypothetical protein